MFKSAFFKDKFYFRIKKKLLAQKKLFPYEVIELESAVQKLSVNLLDRKIFTPPRSAQAFNPVRNMMQSKSFDYRYVYEVGDVKVNTINGNVFSRQGELILESSSWPTHFHKHAKAPDVTFSPPKAHIKLLETGIVFPTTLNFYHWLIEDLPTFIHIRKESKDVPIIINQVYPKFAEDFLRVENIKSIEISNYVKFDRYKFVGRDQDPNWPDPVDVSLLRRYFLTDSSVRNQNGKLKLYVSRISSTRSSAFESELVQKLRESNWHVVELEKINFYKQIELFASASVIAGLHGAGLTGMIWASPGTKMIEICNSEWRYTPVFSRLSTMLDLEYEYLYYSNQSANEWSQLWKVLTKL